MYFEIKMPNKTTIGSPTWFFSDIKMDITDKKK